MTFRDHQEISPHVAWKIRALQPRVAAAAPFAAGLEGAPDLKAAQEVANYLGTVHHEIHFTVQEGRDAIRDGIHHIETYDVTTIRASTPMYLMSRKIKAMGIKMVLSGRGFDEVFGGYLYFHKSAKRQKSCMKKRCVVTGAAHV